MTSRWTGTTAPGEVRLETPVPVTFPLGRVVITATAHSTLSLDDVLTALHKHAEGAWGDLCPEDLQANVDALANGGRLLSSYHDRNLTRFWIITEGDRSATTILLPEDY